MTSLLNLPPELRTYIIDSVISDCRRRPSLENVDEGRVSVARWGKGAPNLGRGASFEVDPNAYKANTNGLLRTNRQLRLETTQRLALTESTAAFELDVICADDRHVYHTWLRVPTVTKDIHTLNVTFRLLRWTNHTAFNPPKVKYAVARPCGMFYWIFGLIENFLQVGPSVPSRGVYQPILQLNNERIEDNDAYPISVGTLILDIEPTWPVAHPLIEADDFHHDIYGHVVYPFTSPTEVTMRFFEDFTLFRDKVCMHLTKLLAMRPYYVKYGSIAYRCIGCIKICVRGTVIEEFDLGQRLADLPGNEPWEVFENQEAKAFETWRKKTFASRKSRGLPVPRSETQTDRG